MKRAALYSSSRRSGRRIPPGAPELAPNGRANESAETGRSSLAAAWGNWQQAARRHKRLLLGAAATLALLVALVQWSTGMRPPPLTQDDIDAAIEHALENRPPEPSPASSAYAAVQSAVVRVEPLGRVEDELTGYGVGTGVVIEDTGVILTNLHVIDGAERVGLRFVDGFESEATVVSVHPENDLAVLQATEMPEDLTPATLRTTAGLSMGERVFVVGHPFDVGPSLSAGVVSGMQRDYVSPEGERLLTDLIQFDAAANPGNSGGPLVTGEGEVVGIVTGILNPTAQRVFIGIGFAVPIEAAAAAAGESPF